LPLYGPVAALYVLWANLHGGFIMGWALFGAATVGCLFVQQERRERTLRLLRHAGVAFAACFLNPYGWQIVVFPVHHMAILHPHRGMPWEVAEWRVPTFNGYEQFWGVLAVIVLIMLLAQIRTRKIDVFGNLVLIAFGYSAVRYVRNIHVFLLVSIPILVPHILALLDRPMREDFRRGARALCYAGALLFASYSAYAAYQNTFGVKIVGRDIPALATRFLSQSGLSGNLYNSYSWGGYIEWALYPKYKAFMDSRYLFVDLLKEESLARETPQTWDAFLQSKNVDIAIVPYPKSFVPMSRKRLARQPEMVFESEWLKFYSPRQWALVHWDMTALVFARRSLTNQAAIHRAEYQFFRPDAYLQVDQMIQAGKLSADEVRAEIERNIREVGPHPAARFFAKFFAAPKPITPDTPTDAPQPNTSRW